VSNAPSRDIFTTPLVSCPSDFLDEIEKPDFEIVVPSVYLIALNTLKRKAFLQAPHPSRSCTDQTTANLRS